MRSAIYARISQDTTTDHLGVERQLADCRAAARDRRWNAVHEYVDNDISATRSRIRPAYTRMLDDIRAGRIDAVIVWDVDRLTRTPRELEDIIDLADAHRLELVSIGGEIDLATPQGRLTARIKGSVARHETDQQSRRIKRKIQEKAEKGQPHGLVPYGFRRVYEQDDAGHRHGRDVPQSEEADVIREATRRILGGQSLRSTVQMLNESGSLSPRGGRWSSATLRQVLLRGTNAGLRTHRGTVVGKATTEAIISEDDHHRLVAVLTDPNRRVQRVGTTPRHLLTGIALCGICGGKMRRLKGAVHGGKINPEAYGCRDCFKIRRNMSLVDRYVEGIVVALLSRPNARAALATGNPDRAKKMEEHAEGLNARLLRAADQFAEGVITAEQMARISAKLRPEIDEARAAVASFMPATGVAQVAGPDAAVRWATTPLSVKREIIDGLMTVTILPAGPGRGADPRYIRATPKRS
jgi:DNA invertase Pin-like site-specific DNA recombinase